MEESRALAEEEDRFPRRVLLLVTGLSPQVVTETLYALAVRAPAGTAPTEVHVVTTSRGAEFARLTLLSEDPGWFHRLCRDYDLQGIRFDADCIHVIADEQDRRLDDIRDDADNRLVADTVTGWVRHFTADPETTLHVSIAGGRKTMGFYAGYALSLYGRPQDRLSHVLVSAPYEANQAFYYPPPSSRVIFSGDNREPLEARDAVVTLADIPFVRLRDGLPIRLQEGHASFSDTVLAAQKALAAPTLTVDLAGRRILAAEEVVSLTEAELAFYAWLARRQKDGKAPVRWDDTGITEEYLTEFRRVAGEMSGVLVRAESSLRAGMDREYFEQRRSRVNKALTRFLGPQLAVPYLIHAHGGRPNTRYGLSLDASSILFSPGGRPRQA